MTQINESMGEGLKKLMGSVAALMTTPDADMEFLSGMQMVIRNQLMAQAAQAAQSTAQSAVQTIGPAAIGAGGMSPGGPNVPTTQSGAIPSMGLGPVPPGQMSPGGGSGPVGPSTPNPDELRRILSQAS